MYKKDTADCRRAVELARLFSRLLLADIGPEKLARVIGENAEDALGQVCHSHAFCDANMVMLAAWQEMTDGPGEPLEEGTTKWERMQNAWLLAKEADFYAERVSEDPPIRLLRTYIPGTDVLKSTFFDNTGAVLRSHYMEREDTRYERHATEEELKIILVFEPGREDTHV